MEYWYLVLNSTMYVVAVLSIVGVGTLGLFSVFAFLDDSITGKRFALLEFLALMCVMVCILSGTWIYVYGR